jgi:uncharacterized membrane protein YphA (DoxX/SURF4 family)
LENKNKHIIEQTGINVFRFFLAITFIFSGFVKAIDPIGTTYKLQDYLTAFKLNIFSPYFLLLIAIALAAVEFVAGFMLFWGIRRHFSSFVAFILLLFMTPLTLYLAIANPVSDCGCFGDAIVLTNWQTFIKNLILFPMSICVLMKRKEIIRFVTFKSEWLISLLSIIFILALSFYCFRALPMIDFRPYKKGTDVLKAMSIPKGAKTDVYETTFILEKNGVKKEFSLANYPDSTWTFIDSKNILKEKGYEPPIHDFSMTDAVSGVDITDSILSLKGYKFLLIAPRVENASDSHIDLINELYDYSKEHGYPFYCLTSSPAKAIESWKDRAGAEYPFCFSDYTTLKTIIRSNPGLLLMKDAVIINKWSDVNIPNDTLLTDRLENLGLGKLNTETVGHTVLRISLWLLTPVFIVIIFDMLIYRRPKKKVKEEDKKEEEKI